MINEITPDRVNVHSLPAASDLRFKNKVRNGGFSVYGYNWIYEEAELVVNKTDMGTVPLSHFHFDRLLHEKSLNISCVTEFKQTASNQCKYKLLVALTRDLCTTATSAGSSWLVLVDVRLHQLIRVIECPFRIVKMEPIVLADQIQLFELPLHNQLVHSDGLLAIGTSTGIVNLLDLQLNDWMPDDAKGTPFKIHIILPESLAQENLNSSTKKRLAHINRELICIPINNDSQYRNQFLYQQSQGEYETIPLDQVEIGSLKYFSQTNTLYVGFSFGGFQGWSMQTLQIVFGCQLEQYLTPVIGFALQEPENDPCNYCYLWVMRGSADQFNDDYQDHIYSSASLFVFEYEHKQWIRDFGFLYSRLMSEGIRFEYYMTSTPYSSNVDADVGGGGGGSSLISYGTIHKHLPFTLQSEIEEENVLMDSSLFHFVWEAYDSQFEHITRYLAIFDLNQWYQAQMPCALQLESASSFASYICFYKLSKLESTCAVRSLLDTHLDPESVSRYQNRQQNNEIAYYPCSLTFQAYFLSESRLFEAAFVGLQNACLLQLHNECRSILLEPAEFLSRCLFAGLLSSESVSQLNTLDKRREAILSLALEHDQLPFLLSTIEWWAQDQLPDTGCNVKFFLNWVWKQVITAKSSVDDIIEMLFDCNCESIDLNELRSHRVLFANLRRLLKALINCSASNTVQGERELIQRLNIVQCILDYIRVVIWLHECELLQSNHSESCIDWSVVYDQLRHTCDQKRTDARHLDPSCTDQELLVDLLVQHAPHVAQLWQEHGSVSSYPPVNLHSAISIYLLDTLSIELKHQLLLYHLYDLITLLEDTHPDIVDELRTFPLHFNLSPELTRLVESFSWFDRDHIQNGASLLRSPAMRLVFADPSYDHKSLDNDLQVRIVRLLLSRQATTQAYLFMNSPMFICNSLVKQQLYIKILMQSRNVLTAFKFQKQHRNQENGQQLLYQLFLDCEELSLFEKLFKFSLDQIEEDALICYLLEVSKSLKSHFLLVIYFFIRDQPFAGANILQSIHNEIDLIQDEQTYNKAVELKSLVQAYFKASPPFLVKMREIISQLKEKQPEPQVIKHRFYKRTQTIKVPEPSVNTPISSYISSLLAKIEQIEQTASKPTTATPFAKRIEQKGLLVGQDSPFLRRKSLANKSKSNTPTLRKSQFVTFTCDANRPQAEGVDNESPVTFANVSFNTTVRPRIVKTSNELSRVLHTPNIKHSDRKKTPVPSNHCATPTSILKVRPSAPVSRRPFVPIRFETDCEEPSAILQPSMDVDLMDEDGDRSDPNDLKSSQINLSEISEIRAVEVEPEIRAGPSVRHELEEVPNAPKAPEASAVPEVINAPGANMTDLQEHDMSVETSQQAPTDEFVFSKTDEIAVPSQVKEQLEQQKQHQDEEANLTPTKITYVFSPPLTRSRKKKSAGKLNLDEQQPDANDTLVKMETTMDTSTATPLPEERKSTRKASKRGSRKHA